ncbi:ATP-binding cassette sub-family B member 9 [Aphelenchoides bicaudatus]|nr:ATP-binding cassette sub-family B member 9 [Aphelenchoides bicaudatus]
MPPPVKGRMRSVVTTLLFVAGDIFFCILCLCAHGTSFSWTNFAGQFREPFSFLHSTIDFFILTLLRSLFFPIGCGILCLHREPQNILKWGRHASLSLSMLFCAFSPTKLLALFEEQRTPFVGDWLIVAQNLIFSIWGHFLWCAFERRSLETPYEHLDEDGHLIDEENEDNSDDLGAPSSTSVVVLRLLQYCKNEWIWHLSGFTWLFIYSLTRVFVPYYTGQVIASVVSAQTDKYAALISAVKLMVAISVVSSISGGFRGGSFEYAYSRINRAVRNDLFAALVNQDVAFFDKHKTGEITSRLTADTQTMSDTVALNINVFLRNIVQMGGSMIFMMALCWRLSMIPFIVVPVIMVASKIFGVYYDFLSEKTQEAVAQSNDVAEEVLSTMRTVRSFACEDVEQKRFYGKLTYTLLVTRQKAVAYIFFLWTSELFQAVINIAVLWYGGHLVLTNQLQKDLLVSFLLYQMQLTDNIRQLGEVWTGLSQSVGASRKVFQYIDRKPHIDTTGIYIPEKVVGRIQFENVSFSYPTRPHLPILKNLSFTVEPGEVVALVGPSGSGKSSCIALLERFYQPKYGKILIDGVPISDYEHQFIHNSLALVGQEPVLFARSISENISYGLDSSLRNNTKQTPARKGSQMSGGQKQRIAIARALVRNPSVLLLDEATSALDTESEHLVQEAIYKNLKGRSVILIAHRLSTVEKADKIIVINKGVVEQMGTHESLLAQEGIYKDLVRRQMISAGDDDTEATATQPQPFPTPSTSRPFNISPRSMAQSLLATSFTQSTTSFQSK